MSENCSREGMDFSKYDTMTSQQLQELLRLDSETANNGAADIEELLYIMEVLAQRKQDSATGEKALESWASFQRDYLDAEEDEDAPNVVPMPARKSSRARRWVAAAAIMVLLIGIPITVSAVNWKEMWDAVIVWQKGHFSFQAEAPSGTKAPATTSIITNDNHTLQQALAAYGEDASIVPSRIPDRYFPEDVTVYETTEKNIYIATYANYENTEEKLTIKVQTFLPSDPGRNEANEGIVEVYEANGVEYYIVRNNKRLKALWLTGPYECFIAGEVTLEEMKSMIDSIGKG